MPRTVARSVQVDENQLILMEQAQAGCSNYDVVRFNGTAFVPASAAAVGTADVAGIIVEISGGVGNVILAGYIDNITGLTAGVTYYLSDTAGGRDIAPGTLNVPLGVALTTNTMHLYHMGLSGTFAHTNRSNLDSINQDLATTDSPSFAGLTLAGPATTLSVQETGGVTGAVITSFLSSTGRELNLLAPDSADINSPFVIDTNNSLQIKTDGSIIIDFQHDGHIDINPEGNDYDFTIFKQTAGEAYNYDAGLDVHTFNGTIGGTAVLDEDTMVSDSDVHIATQQSIKAYVDSTVNGASLVFDYTFLTDTADTDPGSKKIKFNNATYTSVTAINMSYTMDNGIDLTNIINSLRYGNQLYIQQKDDASRAVIFRVTADPADNTTYAKIPVVFEGETGTTIANNKKVGVIAFYGANATMDEFTTDHVVPKWDDTNKEFVESGVLIQTGVAGGSSVIKQIYTSRPAKGSLIDGEGFFLLDGGSYYDCIFDGTDVRVVEMTVLY